jgi:hypothetical protein
VFAGDLPQVGACGAGDAIVAFSAHQLVLLPAMARLLVLDRHSTCLVVMCRWVSVVKDMRAIFSNLEAQGYPRERQEVRCSSTLGVALNCRLEYSSAAREPAAGGWHVGWSGVCSCLALSCQSMMLQTPLLICT